MRRSIALLVVGILLFVPAPPVSAAVTGEFALGVLTVTGDRDSNAIVVECVNGNVRVNGDPPSGGRVGCSEVETILVRAEGGGDRVVLSDVDRAAFDVLLEIGVFGEEGNDTLIGSALADQLDGGSGVDTLRGGGGRDRLVPGGGGGDVIGGNGRDRLVVVGDGDWTISDTRLVHHGPGDEVTTLRSVEVASVSLGPRNDTVSATDFTGSAVLDGGEGDDLLRSGPGRDNLLGRGGDDRLHAGAGNDILQGKRGNDVLRGGDGKDQLLGGPGDDACGGGPGADSELSC